MDELAAALASLRDAEIVRTINIWDDLDTVARMNASRCPALVLWEGGEHTEPGPETDSLWRYYTVRISVFGAYTTSPDGKVDPTAPKTVFAISQQVRKRIAQIPQLSIGDEPVELVSWLPASGGIFTPSGSEDGPNYVYRAQPVSWRVWEEWDGGGTPVTSIFTGINA